MSNATRKWLVAWGKGKEQAFVVTTDDEVTLKHPLLSAVADKMPDITEMPSDYELCSRCGYDHQYEGAGRECLRKREARNLPEPIGQ